jgi:putative restriction endonuclease
VRFYVGITDFDWFSFLSRSVPLDEVNFWRPSPGQGFRALDPGGPFLFKLHSPRNFIVGGGFFSHYIKVPVSYAWKSFGGKNGAHSEQEMRTRLARYRKVSPASSTEDYEIGCILLQSPFFFPEREWIPASDWPLSIQVGKGYDTADLRGQTLWGQVEEWLVAHQKTEGLLTELAAEPASRGEPQIVFPRLGQGSFRVVVADAYKRRCALTGSPVLHVLEAAHIQPVTEDGPNDVRNGILLRQDVHTLFDRGYITVTPQYRVEVSHRIKDEFEDGREYYSAHGQLISLPVEANLHPSSKFLSWHNEKVYLG